MASLFTRADSEHGSLYYLWRSPWTFWIGSRYLRSKKNSRFLSFITFLSILGVAVGVTAMIVVLSVMDGFEAELRKRLLSSDLHILVTPTSRVPGFQSGFVPRSSIQVDQVVNKIDPSRRQVVNFWEVISTEAIMKAGRKVTGVVLKGIGPERISRLKRQMTESADTSLLARQSGEQRIHLPTIYLGQELAFELGAMPGDLVTLVSPTETGGPLESVPRMKRFVVAGIYHSGLPEQELHTVYSTEEAVRAFLRKAEVVTQWEISTRDFDSAGKIAEKMREDLVGFSVQDWMQLNSNLFASLRLERVSMFVILAFIIIVASFNIVTTLTLMVLEKKREIAILKAMGARGGQVAAIFLAEGLFIGAIGVLTGVVLGFVLCSILRMYDFITLPDIYYDRTLPVTFDPSFYFGVSICAVLIVLVACLYPSRRAATLNPLEGIRFG